MKKKEKTEKECKRRIIYISWSWINRGFKLSLSKKMDFEMNHNNTVDRKMLEASIIRDDVYVRKYRKRIIIMSIMV